MSLHPLPSRAVLTAALLTLGCTASDHLIVSHGGSDASVDASGPGGGGSAGSAGSVDAGSSPGPDGAPPDAAPDAAVDAAPPGDDALSSDAGSSGWVAGLSCSAIPSCAAGDSCLCCPLGGVGGPGHCACTIACEKDTKCPAAAPHCNVKKVQGIPVGKGLCTPDTFICQW